jgi:hypothetical protein
LKNERDGSRFFERELFGIGEAVHFGAANELGATSVDHVSEIGKLRTIVVASSQTGGALAAGNAGSEENFLAGFDGGDAEANLLDGAGNIAAGNMRERDGNARDSAAHPEVEMIESAGVDADDDFAGARFGFGNVGVAEDVGAAVVVEKDGFHE